MFRRRRLPFLFCFAAIGGFSFSLSPLPLSVRGYVFLVSCDGFLAFPVFVLCPML
jgi:hypothetical protein